MSFKDRQPSTRNMLFPQSFKLLIHKFPKTEYFVQGVNLPDINVAAAIQPTNFADIPRPGDKVEFEDLVVNFVVDENLDNYKEIFDWIKSYGRAEVPSPKEMEENDWVCDIELLTTKNSLIVNRRVVFRDAFPYQLTGIEFASDIPDAAPLSATVMFKYCTYEIMDLSVDPCA